MLETGDLSMLDLMLRPWLSPQVAVRWSDQRAAMIATAAWGATVGLLCAQNAPGELAVWSLVECARASLVGGICCGTMAGAIAAFFIQLFLPDQDRTTEVGRARWRATVLLPVCWLPALAVWSSLAVLCNRSVRHALGDYAPPHVIKILGSAGMLAIIILAAGLLCAWARDRVLHLHRSEHCLHCGYCLLGLTEPRCPECGEPFDRPRMNPAPR